MLIIGHALYVSPCNINDATRGAKKDSTVHSTVSTACKTQNTEEKKLPIFFVF